MQDAEKRFKGLSSTPYTVIYDWFARHASLSGGGICEPPLGGRITQVRGVMFDLVTVP